MQAAVPTQQAAMQLWASPCPPLACQAGKESAQCSQAGVALLSLLRDGQQAAGAALSLHCRHAELTVSLSSDRLACPASSQLPPPAALLARGRGHSA